MLLDDVLVYELRIPPFNLLISLEKKIFFLLFWSNDHENVAFTEV